jgi:hypothetical protein
MLLGASNPCAGAAVSDCCGQLKPQSLQAAGAACANACVLAAQWRTVCVCPSLLLLCQPWVL